VVFLFIKASRLELGPTHPATRWVLETHFTGSKRLVLEAKHSPHVVSRSRMSGGRPLLPPFAGMWCRRISVASRLFATWIMLNSSARGSSTCCSATLCCALLWSTTECSRVNRTGTSVSVHRYGGDCSSLTSSVLISDALRC